VHIGEFITKITLNIVGHNGVQIETSNVIYNSLYSLLFKCSDIISVTKNLSESSIHIWLLSGYTHVGLLYYFRRSSRSAWT